MKTSPCGAGVWSQQMRFLRLCGVALSILSFACACTPKNTGSEPQAQTNNITTQCGIKEEQRGTLKGRWELAPIPLAVHSGDFTIDEMREILNAVDTWNRFFDESHSFYVLDLGKADSLKTTAQAIDAGECGRDITEGNQFVSGAAVGLFKIKENWLDVTNRDRDTGRSISQNVIAVTEFCHRSSSPYEIIYNGVILVNFEDFFVPDKRKPDLESIVLHELGHLMGLNHSCEMGSTADGMPDCDETKDEYYSAVMYPIVFFSKGTGRGEVRRALQTNDQERANCIYSNELTQIVAPGSPPGDLSDQKF